MLLGSAARRLAPVAVPFLLAVVLLAPATLGGKVMSASDVTLFSAPFPSPPPGAAPQNALQSDSAYQFEPDGLQVRQALRDGRLPVWTPLLSAGRPLLATQQTAPLYPLTWIDVVFPYWASLVWIAVLKITLAALGTFLLARALGLASGPALLGGVSFGLGTYLMVWLMHPHSNAYIVLPWLFLLAERICQTGAVRDAAALGAGFGVAYLGGQPESALIVSLASAAWVTHRLIAAHPARREALRRGALAAGAILLGIALAAVMILPFLEALHASYAVARGGDPLPAKSVVTLLLPKYWLVGPANFTERTLYVGVLPTMLGAAGLVARRPRGPQLFFAGLAAAALVVALNTGPLTDFVRGLPVLALVNLNRLLILASFAVAMLAAFGCERLLTATRTERRRMVLVAAVVGLAPALVVLAAHASWLEDLGQGVRRAFNRDTSGTAEVYGMAALVRLIGLAAATLALLAALTRWRRHATVVVVAAVALTAADLIGIAWRYNPAIPKAQAAPPTPPAVDVMRRLTADGGRVVGIRALKPNTASRWGLADLRGGERPVVERSDRLFFALGGGIEDATTNGLVPRDPRTPKLIDVFGVKAVLLDASARRRPQLPVAPPLSHAPVAYAGPGGVVLENRFALPPAFVSYRWRPSPGLDASLFLMAAGTARQARNDPVIERLDAPPERGTIPATPARVVSRSDTSVRIDVRARAPGQLVLLDTFYPGWRAQVDGHPAPIRPANAAFQAVPVGRGRHEVQFSYRPASVLVGGLISVLALIVIAAGVLLGRRRGPRGHPPAGRVGSPPPSTTPAASGTS